MNEYWVAVGSVWPFSRRGAAAAGAGQQAGDSADGVDSYGGVWRYLLRRRMC